MAPSSTACRRQIPLDSQQSIYRDGAGRCLPILATIARGEANILELDHVEGSYWEVDLATNL